MHTVCLLGPHGDLEPHSGMDIDWLGHPTRNAVVASDMHSLDSLTLTVNEPGQKAHRHLL